MLTDTYGGICPNCGYDRMCMRYGSNGYFQYDACPNCGFALGEWFEGNEENHWEYESGRDYDIWNSILSAEEKFQNKLEFGENLTKYLLKIEELPNIKGKKESVFDYSKWRKKEWQIDHKNKK